MVEASFLHLSDRCPTDGSVSVRPAWEVREGAEVTSWYHVRLEFTDGARVEALTVVAGADVSVEDVRSWPALSLEDLSVLADWIEQPVAEACAGGAGTVPSAARRARPAPPHGAGGRELVAREYRAAQAEGTDPVLAVMCATGHSRRTSLRLIARARDAGLLTPRHVRR
jgi:hypothetical protein